MCVNMINNQEKVSKRRNIGVALIVIAFVMIIISGFTLFENGISKWIAIRCGELIGQMFALYFCGWFFTRRSTISRANLIIIIGITSIIKVSIPTIQTIKMQYDMKNYVGKLLHNQNFSSTTTQDKQNQLSLPSNNDGDLSFATLNQILEISRKHEEDLIKNINAITKIIENILQTQILFTDKKAIIKAKKNLGNMSVLLDERKSFIYDSKKAVEDFIMTKLTKVTESERISLIKSFNEGFESIWGLIFEEWFVLAQELLSYLKIIVDLAEKEYGKVHIKDNLILFEKNEDIILYNSTVTKIVEIIDAIDRKEILLHDLKLQNAKDILDESRRF